MAYIPEDAEWYLADVVEMLQVSGHATIIVHINTLLVRADSPEEAYFRAMTLGRQGLGARGRSTYRNLAGEKVTTTFLGLSELNVIHDPLEDGAEISYRERRVLSLDAAKKLVARKQNLAVFRPRRPTARPDYMSGDIAKELVDHFGSEVRAKPRRRRKAVKRLS